MKRKEVSYDAIVISEKSKEELTALAKNLIEGLEVRPAMHMTLMHYGKKTDEEKEKIQLNNIELGKEVELKISALGIYRKNGVIMNVGAKIELNCLNQDLGYGRTLSEIFGLAIPHVTIAINAKEDAQSVDTKKCFGKGLEEGDTYEIIPLDKLFTLTGKSTAVQSIKKPIKTEIKAEELEDMPRDPQRHQEKMTIEEIVKALEYYKINSKEINNIIPNKGAR